MVVDAAALTETKSNSAHTAELELNLMLAESKINFPGGWVAGLSKNKANSAQLGLAGAWAELGKNGYSHI